MELSFWIRLARPFSYLVPGIEIGGPGILRGWLEEVITCPHGSITIICPFIDECLFDSTGPLRWFWTSINHKSCCLRVWTRSREGGFRLNQLLARWNWGDLNIHFGGTAHAKVYMHLMPDGNVSAVVGSMNFTRAGLNGKGELGLLARTRFHSEFRKPLVTLHESLKQEMLRQQCVRQLCL